jgi:DNA-binding transcriptional regulator LsrR (DeoR family)
MLIVATIARIRREYFLKGRTIRAIARELHIARTRCARWCARGRRGGCTIEMQARPKLGEWTAQLDQLLAGNAAKPARG